MCEIDMYHFERKYSSYNLIGGIDEVGRGALAGPVISACVILPVGCNLAVMDSKKLTAQKRERLFYEIKRQAVAVAIGLINNSTIDEINILNATKLSMLKAVEKISPIPNFLLIDALTLNTSLPQLAIKNGDNKSASIAAASIIAKVTRDNMMIEYHNIYPQYGFNKHKGYGVPNHKKAIQEFGMCKIHRKSFKSTH